MTSSEAPISKMFANTLIRGLEESKQGIQSVQSQVHGLQVQVNENNVEIAKINVQIENISKNIDKILRVIEGDGNKDSILDRVKTVENDITHLNDFSLTLKNGEKEPSQGSWQFKIALAAGFFGTITSVVTAILQYLKP